MDAPLDRRSRQLLHLAFGVGLALTAGYVVGLAGEPHAGFDVPTDGVVAHVAAGSGAAAAGLDVGDRLAAGEAARWRSPPVPSTVRVVRDGRELVLALPRAPASLAQRVLWFPWYRFALIGVGLTALGIGWWIVTRNPDAPGMVPLALSTAAAAPVFAAVGPSLVWTEAMVRVHLVYDVVAVGLFQAFGVHWLLSFPRRVGGRGAVVATYVAAGAGVVALLAVARAGPVPAAWIYLRAGVAALLVLGLCVVQLARAPTRRTRQQAAWVLAGVAAYTATDLLLWELPGVAGLPPLGSTGTVNALVGLSYLLIPIGIGVAVTREGLFGIDRFVTPGLAYGATVVVLVVAYAALAAGLAEALGRAPGSLPTAVAAGLAAALFALLLPVQTWLFARFDRVFNRHERVRRAALAAFEAGADVAQTDADLRAALADAVRDGLGLTRCAVVAEPSGEVVARPGALDVRSAEGVRLDADLADAVRVPLPGGAGTARLGRRRSGARVTEDHLALLDELGRRFGRASERLHLLRELSDRELEVARTRLRIAGDLHDDIGASLSSMAVLSDLVRRNEALPSADRSRLARLSTSARTLVDDLRDIVWAIDPSSDRLHDLAERLRDTAAALLPGVRCAVEAPAEADLPLDMEARRHLLLVAKEALHNVARHADASAVSVRLAATADALELTVEDDGRGFDPATAGSGHGLSSLRERADQLGGTLTVASEPGRGARVALVVPRPGGTARTRRAPGDGGPRS